MTTPSRIAWPTGLTAGVRYIPIVLVAGVPRVLVPSGTHPTTTAITFASDPAWWPGSGSLTQSLPGAITFDPVREVLDPGHVWEVYEEARPLEGDVKVDALTFDLYDPDGIMTADLSAREARTTQLLASDVTATDTSIPLASTSSVPSSGIACVGRETLVYDGVGGGALTITSAPAGRGKYGSLARPHLAPATHQPLVAFAGPRHWQGRRAALFVAKLSADGTTITDPTLLYLGTVGAGVQLVRGGMRWSLPLDHVTVAAARKLGQRTVDLYGYAHFAADFTQPLQVGWTGDIYLDDQASAPSAGGWHQGWSQFKDAWLRRAGVVGGVTINGESPTLTFYFSGGGSPTRATIYAAWDRPVRQEQDLNTSGSIGTHRAPPAVCLHLDGRVRIPDPQDFTKIPSALSWASSSGPDATAYLALAAKTDNTDRLVARITARNAGASEVTVRAQLPATMVRAEDRQQATVITQRTQAEVAVIAAGATPLAALQIASDAIDALGGSDLQTASVDWDGLARLFASYPQPITERRAFTVAAEDSLLSLLIGELRLRGMALCVRNGLISGYRPASFASTEPVRATIAKTDVLIDGATGELAEWEVIDSTQPLATKVTYELADGSTFAWVDTTFSDEFGDGAEVKVSALKHAPVDLSTTDLRTALQGAAWQLLGPLAEPSRIVRLPLPPTFLHLQPGDLVSVTHDMVPSWAGTRGIAGATCQVVECRRQLWGGQARLVVGLRLQSEDLAGYAPEALVAAGGLDHASHTITLDTSSGWGASCFARDTDTASNAVTDPLDGFAKGDKVYLSEIDTESPATDESFTVTAVDTSAHTVTLDGYPSLAMAALAAAAYKVVLRFQSWTAATARQQKYAFIADDATGEFSDGHEPKRWAA